MTTVNATITFGLPEDTEVNQIEIFSSPNENGSFAQEASYPYDYGQVTLQYDIDSSLWYRIRFANALTGRVGAVSEAVYGGTFNASSPFLAISSTHDGANYATTQDVYDYADLNSQDVTSKKVSTALRRARAEIDFRTSEMGIDRFEMFDTNTARRKYNASLQILKEAEICLALQQIYLNLSDNVILKAMRDVDNKSSAGDISIGQTSISGDSLEERNENIIYLATLAARYGAMAEAKLAQLDQNSIRLVPTDFKPRVPRFRYPFNWA